jgi:hypothetical protein
MKQVVRRDSSCSEFPILSRGRGTRESVAIFSALIKLAVRPACCKQSRYHTRMLRVLRGSSQHFSEPARDLKRKRGGAEFILRCCTTESLVEVVQSGVCQSSDGCILTPPLSPSFLSSRQQVESKIRWKSDHMRVKHFTVQIISRKINVCISVSQKFPCCHPIDLMVKKFKMTMQTLLGIRTGLILYILPLPVCILSLWSPQFTLRGPLFSTLILFPLFLAQLYPFTSDSGFRFGLMLPWYIYFGTVAKILFSVPERSFWRLGHEREEAVKMKEWGWAKFRWSVALMCSMRGVGWNFQVKGLPALEKENETKGQFLTRQLASFVWLFLATDLSSLVLRRVHFQPGVNMSARDLDWGTRFLVLLVMGVQSYCSTSMLYQWFAIFGVLLGVSEQKVSNNFDDPSFSKSRPRQDNQQLTHLGMATHVRRPKESHNPPLFLGFILASRSARGTLLSHLS